MLENLFRHKKKKEQIDDGNATFYSFLHIKSIREKKGWT